MGKTKLSKGNGKKAKPPEGASGVAAPAFDILTLDEAAALLRVTADELRTGAERGTVPARLIGSEWRFSRPTLWGWVTSPPVTSAPNGTRQKLADLPMPDITPEEYEAYRAEIAASRDEVDRVTKSGKYAEDE